MIIFFDIDETLIDQRQAGALAAAKFLRDYGDRLHPCAMLRSRRWRVTGNAASAFLNGRIPYDEQHREALRD